MWSWIFLLSLFVCGSLGEDLARSKKRLSCLNVGSSAGGVGDNTAIDIGNGFIPPSSTEYPHLVDCALPKPTTEIPNNNGNDNNTDCGDEADIVFLVDTSGSVGMVNFNTLLQFVQNVVQRFTIGPNDIQIGVDVFSTFVTSEFNLNTYDNEIDIVSAIGNITYRGGQTNIADSIDFMVNDSFSTASGHRPGIPKIAIIITDGGSDDKPQTLIEAQKARDSGITMITVGVGSSVDAAELQGIANKPSSQYVFRAQNFNVLNTLQASLAAKTCTGQRNSTTFGNGTESGTGSSAGEQSNKLPVVPAASPIETPSQTGTETGSSTGNNTIINNGTATGTGSSAGGTTAPPQAMISSTLLPTVPPTPTRSKKSATSASEGENNCEFFCPDKGAGTNSPQSTNSPTTSPAPVTTVPNSDKTTIRPTNTPKPTSIDSTRKITSANQGSTKTGSISTTVGQIATGSSVRGNVVTTVTAGSSGIVSTVTSLPIIVTTDDLNVTEECRDLIDCRPYPKERVCPANSTYRAWAEVRCKVWCSFCDPHTSPMPCGDMIPNCNEYGGDLCTNPLYRLFREDNCEKFCGICKDNRSGKVTPTAYR